MKTAPMSAALTSVARSAAASRDEQDASLEELDALVAASLPTLEELEQTLERSRASDDQATRLRSIARAGEDGVREAPVARPDVRTIDDAPRARTERRGDGVRAATSASGGAKVVVVASGKGGVGKTTLSVNLAVALAQRGVRVTLLDADFGTANADVLCGITPAARLDHVFVPGAGGERYRDGGARTLRDIAISAPGGFRLIPGTTGVARMADLSAGERQAIVSAMEELDTDTDVLLVDAGAGVGRSVTAFMGAADLTLVVATPEPTSIADAYALIKCAQSTQEMQTPGEQVRVALVFNQVMDGAEAARVYGRISAVCDRFLGLKCRLLGSIAQDVRVSQSVRSREPLLVRWPASSASVQIRALGESLTQYLGVRTAEHAIGGRSGGARGMVRRLLGL